MIDRKKIPNLVDIHIGYQIRLRRLFLGISQIELGKKLNISFQQIQKYEKGSNRISASCLQSISEVLAVPVSYFYEGLTTINVIEKENTELHDDESNLVEFYSNKAILQFIQSLKAIKNPEILQNILGLAEALSHSEYNKPIKKKGKKYKIK